MHTMPDGWMLPSEVEMLYRLGKTGRSIIEVGSWIGRSTCAIATGIKDSGAPGKPPKRFDVLDYGITGAADWSRRFGSVYLESDPKFKVIENHGGVGGTLMQNLADRDLLKYVDLVILGDLKFYSTTQRYDAAFLDCLHSDEEIEANMPLIRPLLKREFVFLSDDMHDDGPAAKVAAHLGVDQWWLSRPRYPYTKLGLFWTPGMAANARRIVDEQFASEIAIPPPPAKPKPPSIVTRARRKLGRMFSS